MIIEISVLIVALAFAGLVIYLITLIKSMRALIGQMNQTISHVRTQLVEMGGEAKKIIERTDLIGMNVQEKMEALDPVFKAASNIGDVLEHRSAAFKQEALAIHSEADFVQNEPGLSSLDSPPQEKAAAQDVYKIADFLELIGISIRLWQKLKKRR